VRSWLFLLTIVTAACAGKPDMPPDQAPPMAGETAMAPRPEAAGPDLGGAVPVRLWATVYYLLDADPVEQDGVPLRNMTDEVIGPSLAERTWCAAAIEGSVRIDGATYNYAGVRDPRQADCSHRPSERVRWTISRFPYGTGSRNNPLVPYKTVACDLGTVRGSEPWLNGVYPPFGTRIFIPEAVGTELPDGRTHDGIFTCGDIGGAITGNHIDVFVGAVRGGTREALRKNPFSFVSSNPEQSFEAFVLP
jgi:hypothetical protein